MYKRQTPDRVIIEPSGVGKLSDVMKAVRDVAAEVPVTLNSAVTVADASKCRMYMKNFGEFFNNQIECAGTIVLSRTDITDPKKVQKACLLYTSKNIVRVLLENYSFDVIDLGKDVPPETVVETAIREQVPLVGLSALMTTTVPSMEETIRQLHERAPGVKIMVGGAVLTEEYARTIHADAYCRDAMASVNYAERVFAGMKGEI